jgi:hypothetical protein
MTGWNIRSTVGIGIANTALNVMWRPTSEQSQAISDAAAKSGLSLDDFTSQFSSLNELLSAVFGPPEFFRTEGS